VLYGQEKNRDTIHITKMNLAVHRLEGKIAGAITYSQDEHSLAAKCDFVMATRPLRQLEAVSGVATDLRDQRAQPSSATVRRSSKMIPSRPPSLIVHPYNGRSLPPDTEWI
jgi:type I restriction-modification system DNA methylase subunit